MQQDGCIACIWPSHLKGGHILKAVGQSNRLTAQLVWGLTPATLQLVITGRGFTISPLTVCVGTPLRMPSSSYMHAGCGLEQTVHGLDTSWQTSSSSLWRTPGLSSSLGRTWSRQRGRWDLERVEAMLRHQRLPLQKAHHACGGALAQTTLPPRLLPGAINVTHRFHRWGATVLKFCRAPNPGVRRGHNPRQPTILFFFK